VEVLLVLKFLSSWLYFLSRINCNCASN